MNYFQYSHSSTILWGLHQNVLTVVCFSMQLQIFTSRKCFGAQITFIRFLTSMNSNVFLELRRANAAMVAILANVGLFSTVRSLVHCQSWRVGKALSASLTNIRLLSYSKTTKILIENLEEIYINEMIILSNIILPVWVRLWIIKLLEVVNPLPQKLQTWSLSPVWVFICIANDPEPHNLQIKRK